LMTAHLSPARSLRRTPLRATNHDSPTTPTIPLLFTIQNSPFSIPFPLHFTSATFPFTPTFYPFCRTHNSLSHSPLQTPPLKIPQRPPNPRTQPGGWRSVIFKPKTRVRPQPLPASRPHQPPQKCFFLFSIFYFLFRSPHFRPTSPCAHT